MFPFAKDNLTKIGIFSRMRRETHKCIQDPLSSLPKAKDALSSSYIELLMYNCYMEERQFQQSLIRINDVKAEVLKLSRGILKGSSKEKAEQDISQWLAEIAQQARLAKEDVEGTSIAAREENPVPVVSEEDERHRNQAIIEDFKLIWNLPESGSKPVARKKAVSVTSKGVRDPEKVLQNLADCLAKSGALKVKVLCAHLKACGKTAQTILDIFQLMLYYVPNMDRYLSLSLITIVRDISRKTGLFPIPFVFEGLDFVGELGPDQRTYYGGNGDIHIGIYQERLVCVKMLRYNDQKALGREVVLWGQISHPNLLPFYGICDVDLQSSPKKQTCLVSPWAKNGTILDFLQSAVNAGSPIPMLTRFRLCSDIVAGLKYLHETGLMHGDLKEGNILIDRSYRAYLADFGHASVDQTNLALSQHLSTSFGGTKGYLAPEVVLCKGNNTNAIDIFCFGLLCWEIFAGRRLAPDDMLVSRTFHDSFSGRKNSDFIENAIVEGYRPRLLPYFPADLRQLMTDCWEQEPAERPTTFTLAERLTQMLGPVQDDRKIGEWQGKQMEGMAPIRERVRRGEAPLTSKALEEMKEVLEALGVSPTKLHHSPPTTRFLTYDVLFAALPPLSRTPRAAIFPENVQATPALLHLRLNFLVSGPSTTTPSSATYFLRLFVPSATLPTLAILSHLSFAEPQTQSPTSATAKPRPVSSGRHQPPLRRSAEPGIMPPRRTRTPDYSYEELDVGFTQTSRYSHVISFYYPSVDPMARVGMHWHVVVSLTGPNDIVAKINHVNAAVSDIPARKLDPLSQRIIKSLAQSLDHV
ncbi:hypothetical protein H0H92_007392 [Tricholoma furcatifolium]|nr:hypothetical protein H0H92_007392 [Tricholoma furcatifolium]